MSSHQGVHTRRAASVVSATLPNSFRDASRALSGSSPSAMRSSAAILKCARISSSKSSSSSRRRFSQENMGGLRYSSVAPLLVAARRHRRLHHAADGVDQFGPARFLTEQLLLAFGREAIELGALIGGRLAP